MSLQPNLNAELLYCGTLLHDIGKTEEYDVASISFEMTTRGKLLGHIIMGAGLLEERLEAISGFPGDLRCKLQHMLLSHHGTKEQGSPEVPKTFEAFALFHADLTSARLNQFALALSRARNSNAESEWTEWDRFLDRSLYIG